MFQSRVLSMALSLLALFPVLTVPAYSQDCSNNPANSGRYTISLSIPGLANGGIYTPICYSWGPSAASTGEGVSRELTVTTSVDNTVAQLMTAAQSKQVFPSAELQQAFAFFDMSNTVDIQMTNVRIVSVRITGDSQQPQREITLRFDSVVFTFQPLLANGQKAGPPVSFSTTFR